jgi:acyl carrier protein
VQMLVALEETYGIEISDEDAENLANFGDLVSYIEKRVASKGS